MQTISDDSCNDKHIACMQHMYGKWNTENCGLYWTAKIEAEEEDMRSYRCLCRYDESTGNVFITEVKGYIIDGGIPGKEF